MKIIIFLFVTSLVSVYGLLDTDQTYQLCSNIRGLVQSGVPEERVFGSLDSYGQRLISSDIELNSSPSRQGNPVPAGLTGEAQRVVNSLPTEMKIDHKNKSKKRAHVFTTTAVASGLGQISPFGIYNGDMSSNKVSKSKLDASEFLLDVAVGTANEGRRQRRATLFNMDSARPYRLSDTSMIRQLCGL
ncbi:uncharacterized protein LOC141858252 [Brevipalpus obovatus]|uniref:uncharacterized protein LOC141858252 n=1 Tax=Brevipalpus obovatus TaxID=246614 RepID=UPI003D9F5F08